MGHFSRSLSLLRLSSRRHRRQRARRGFCDPLGLWLADGPVRDLAGRRLEGSGALDRRRHRRGEDACRCAAAAMGERGSRGERRSRARRRLFGRGKRIQGALDPARVSPSILSRSNPGREVAGRHDDHGNRRGARVAHRRRHRHRVVQEQAEHHRRRRARWASRCNCRGREKLARARYLADARAVFGRGKPGVGNASGTSGEVGSGRSGGCQVSAHGAAPQVQLDPDRRRSAGNGAGRRLRIHHALRPGCRRAGILYRPGRGRSGTLAGRRRKQGARRARCAGSRSRSERQPARSVSVPAHLFPASGHRDGIQKRTRRQRHRLSAAVGRGHLQFLRAALGRESAGAGALRKRIPSAAAGAQHTGSRQDRHRDPGNDAGQYARRRICLRV